MPKDERKITSAVRFGGTVYTSGMEDELEASGVDLARLQERGAIEGFAVKGKVKSEGIDAAPAASSRKTK